MTEPARPAGRDYDAHGPDAYATGQASYAHLGHMTTYGIGPLASHLEADHHTTPDPGQTPGSWCRDVETHADAHGVVLTSATEP